MKKIAIVFTLVIGGLNGFSQTKISGITPEKSIKVENIELQLNGAGLREKFFLDLYVASLYVTNKTSDGNKVINADEPMAIKIHIVSGLISSETMTDALDDGFENSIEGNRSTFESKIKEFKNSFSDEIVKGNVFTIAYLPNVGTVVYKNGKKKSTIKGLAFKKAVFGIWLCEEPANEGLKKDMLGL